MPASFGANCPDVAGISGRLQTGIDGRFDRNTQSIEDGGVYRCVAVTSMISSILRVAGFCSKAFHFVDRRSPELTGTHSSCTPIALQLNIEILGFKCNRLILLVGDTGIEPVAPAV